MNIDKKFIGIHKIKRSRHHNIIHHIHKKHKLSYMTIFYMKEYGTKSHAASTIIKESIKILVLASILSSIGGLGIENMKDKFLAIMPLIIMLPALNDMIGDYGTIISSKFALMIYTGKVKLGRGIFASSHMRILIRNVFLIAIISSIYVGAVSYGLSYMQGFAFDLAIFAKVMGISVFCTMALVSIIFLVSVASGIYVYKRKEDPNNFLVPITTSIADFGSMLLFSFLVIRLF